MTGIIPRWEWRSFGSHFGKAEARLKAGGADKLQHSDEIYLLSSINGANVKIRDGLMDIKRLEKTDSHGFEQWRPVLKEAFPLSPGTVEAVFAVLGIAPPQVTAAIMLDQLLADVKNDSRLRALNVHKVRARYHLEGCLAELTEVTADGKMIRTMAIESEDPAHITAALQALGIEGSENVSYPHGLKQLLKMTD